jgi:hypothetical protein
MLTGNSTHDAYWVVAFHPAVKLVGRRESRIHTRLAREIARHFRRVHADRYRVDAQFSPAELWTHRAALSFTSYPQSRSVTKSETYRCVVHQSVRDCPPLKKSRKLCNLSRANRSHSHAALEPLGIGLRVLDDSVKQI